MQDFPQEALRQHPWKETQPSPLEREEVYCYVSKTPVT